MADSSVLVIYLTLVSKHSLENFQSTYRDDNKWKNNDDHSDEKPYVSCHPNFRTTFDIMDKIQKRTATWGTRGTVSRVSHRKWRVRARSLSTETAATVNKETPDVVQAVLPWSSLNQQYAFKFLSSSAILDATKSGWHTRPARRSEAAKEPKRTKDGVWRLRFFLIAKRIVELATNVATPNNKLRIQVRTFVAKSSSALSKLMPLNNKQAFPVLFMSEESYVTVLTWSSYHCLLAMVSAVCLSVQCKI